MDIVNIFYIILLISASILCIGLVFYLNRITNSIKDIENRFNDLSNELKPLITAATELSEKLNYLSGEVKGQIGIIKGTISKVTDRVDKILSLEEQFREGLERPIFGLLKNLSAVSNGINTFWKTFTK
ncbi:MAG TPA: hypothetical protein VI230_00460 [Ignavibacteriaceae bacterium]